MMDTLNVIFLFLFLVLVAIGFTITWQATDKILEAQQEQLKAIQTMLDTQREFLLNLKIEE